MPVREDVNVDNDPLWYKDAIIYEVHVRAFHDSANDGMGDFRGLTQKLDYLQDLGVTAIWLLPFSPRIASLLPRPFPFSPFPDRTTRHPAGMATGCPSSVPPGIFW